MTKYIKLDAWHIAKPDDSETLCGEMIPEAALARTDLPAEKSCELCLRIQRRLDEDQA